MHMVQRRQRVSCTHKEVSSKDLNNKKFHSISIGSAIPGTKIKLLDNGKFSKKKEKLSYMEIKLQRVT